MPGYTKIHRWMVRIMTALLTSMPVSAFAQADLFDKGMQEDISWIVTTIISGLNIMTWVIFVVLTFLLDPAFIFDLGGSNAFLGKLNQIWTLSRDLMNVAFAVLLIAAAVYVVIRAKKDLISEYAPKFILSVILVNFSWFGPLLIIDVANVAAAAAFGIPSLILDDAECRVVSNKPLPGASCELGTKPDTHICGCRAVVDAKFLLDEETLKTYESDRAKELGWTCQGGLMCLQYENLQIDTVSGHSAILNGLIVNHARLQYLATVAPDGGGDGPGKLFKFMIRQLLILVIHVALFFPLAAIALAFAIRIPVLWLTLAFMPFVFLQFVVKENFTLGWPQKIWSAFLKAAFLPAIVAIPLSVGFIMINAGSTINLSSIAGSLDVGIDINDAIGDIHELLWLGMSLGVLWAGVFSILKDMGPMSFGSEAIKGMGQTLGKIAVKAPLATVPLPGVGNILSVPNKLRGFEQGLSSSGGLRDAMKGWSTAPSQGTQTNIANAGTALKSDPALRQTFKDETQRLIDAIKATPQDREAHITKFREDIRVKTQGRIKMEDLSKDNIMQRFDELQRQSDNSIDAQQLTALRDAVNAANASTPPPAGGTGTPPPAGGGTPPEPTTKTT